MSIYVKHGTVKSMKTSNLLSVAYNYDQQGKNIVCLKPEEDTRDVGYIRSSDGKERECYTLKKDGFIQDILVNHSQENKIDSIDAIFIDECQFLSEDNVSEIIRLSGELGFNFLCYGLYSDNKGIPWEATTILMAYSKHVEEISTILCTYCSSKARMNLKLENNKPVFTGDSIDIDKDVKESKFVPVCPNCFIKSILEQQTN